MKVSSLAVILLILAALAVSAGCTGPAADPGSVEMKDAARDLAISINSGLYDMKSGLKNQSVILSASGLSGAATREALAENLRHYPWATSSLAIAPDGIVRTAVPGTSGVREGFSLAGRPQVERANAARAPLVSRAFMTEEGFLGISQSYPVVSPGGEYLGYIDITYAPATFLGRYVEPVMARTGYDVWVIQDDGTEIYDSSPEEIGKNIITDAVYADPSVKAVAARIVSEPSGTGVYTFWDREWSRNVTKTAVWETAGIDGAAWRVGVTRADTGRDGKRPAVTTPVQESPDARLANLTRMVERAAGYAKVNGREAALREFNNVNGSFISGDLYIFAYDMNGIVLALPYQPGRSRRPERRALHRPAHGSCQGRRRCGLLSLPQP